MDSGVQACVLAILVLHDEEIPVTPEKINALLKAAGVSVESYWPSLFAKLAQNKDIGDLILNAGSGGGAAVALSAPGAGGGGAAAAAAVAPAAEEKKEEVKEESDDDMGFGLFD